MSIIKHINNLTVERLNNIFIGLGYKSNVNDSLDVEYIYSGDNKYMVNKFSIFNILGDVYLHIEKDSIRSFITTKLSYINLDILRTNNLFYLTITVNKNSFSFSELLYMSMEEKEIERISKELKEYLED